VNAKNAQEKKEKALQQQSKELTAKNPTTWTTDDVSIWLQLVKLGEYTPIFKEQQISGQELMELTENDVHTLGIQKLGHRKRFQKALSMLAQQLPTDFYDNVSDSSLSTGKSLGPSQSNHFLNNPSLNEALNSIPPDTSSMNESDTLSSSNTPSSDVRLKLYYNDEITVSVCKRETMTFSQLKLNIIEQFNLLKPKISYKDSDGDMITLKSDDEMKMALNFTSNSTLKIYIENLDDPKPNKSSTSSNSEAQKSDWLATSQTILLESMVNAVVIIAANDKRIKYFNASAERMFGLSKAEVKNQKVEILMQDDIGKVHDKYVNNYIETGVSKIIGKGRKVMAKNKFGDLFPVWLSLAETNGFKGIGNAFTATLYDLRSDDALSQSKH